MPEFERLQRALRIHEDFLASGGGEPADLLSRHRELSDLLAPLLQEAEGVMEDDWAHPAPSPTRRAGDFELGRELGRGGMGIVYEAVQISLRRPVAVKVLHPGLELDARARQRFLREAELAASLDHPSIVKVISAHADGEFAFYAMERVDGVSLDRVIDSLRQHGGSNALTGALLRQVVQRLSGAGTDAGTDALNGTWPVDYLDATSSIVAQVADALQHAHDHGVIHRDVKPGNILLRPDGSVLLADFGLARTAVDLGVTRSGDIVGTPHYSSPEQITGSRRGIDARTDQFSLGVTLYELWTLVRPFNARSAAEVRQRIVTKEPADPRSRNRKISRDYCAVVQKALEKDPERRYANLAELAAELRSARDGHVVAARPVPRWVVLGRWMRRNPWASAAMAALASLTITAWLLAASVARASERQRRAGVRAEFDAARIVTRAGHWHREGALWRAHGEFDSRETFWSLVEFYRRFPIRATLGDPADPYVLVSSTYEGSHIGLGTRSGLCELRRGDDLALVDSCSLQGSKPVRGWHITRDFAFRLGTDGDLAILRWCDRRRMTLRVDAKSWLLGDVQYGGRFWLKSNTTDAPGIQVVSWSPETRSSRRELGLPGAAELTSGSSGYHFAKFMDPPRVAWFRSGTEPSDLTELPTSNHVERIGTVTGAPAVLIGYADRIAIVERTDDKWNEQNAANWLPGRGFTGYRNRVLGSNTTNQWASKSGEAPRSHLPLPASLRSVICEAGVLTLSSDGSLRIWDTHPSEPRAFSSGAGTMHAVEFLDRRRLVAVGSRGVNLGQAVMGANWRLSTDAKERLQGQLVDNPASRGSGIVNSPSRDFVAISSVGKPAVVVRRVDDEGALGPARPLQPELGTASFVAISPSGRNVAAPSATIGEVGVWTDQDWQNGRRLRFESVPRFAAVTFCGNDLLLAAGGYGTLVGWDLRSDNPQAKVIAQIPDAGFLRTVAAWQSGGNRFAAVGCDDGTIRIFELNEAPRHQTIRLQADSAIYALAIGRFEGERLLASADSSGAVRLHAPETATTLCVLQSAASEEGNHAVFGLRFSSDGELLAAAGQPDRVTLFRIGYAHQFVAANAVRARFAAAKKKAQ